MLIECCVEFITLVSSEANEISEKEAKKTIACDHITKALEQLGFSDYVPAVLEAAQEHKEVQKVGYHYYLLGIWDGADIIPGPREEVQQVRAERHEHRGTGEAPGGAVRAGGGEAHLRLCSWLRAGYFVFTAYG